MIRGAGTESDWARRAADAETERAGNGYMKKKIAVFLCVSVMLGQLCPRIPAQENSYVMDEWNPSGSDVH